MLSFFNCCFHLLINCLLRWANGVLRHCASAATVSSSNFCKSRMARMRRWYFWRAGNNDKWWQCNVKNQQIVEKLGVWNWWIFSRIRETSNIYCTIIGYPATWQNQIPYIIFPNYCFWNKIKVFTVKSVMNSKKLLLLY